MKIQMYAKHIVIIHGERIERLIYIVYINIYIKASSVESRQLSHHCPPFHDQKAG